MEHLNCWTLRDLARRWDVDDRVVYQHGLEALARRLPLWTRLQKSPVWHDFSGVVNKWTVTWRYNPLGVPETKAREFLDAIDRVFAWLETNR